MANRNGTTQETGVGESIRRAGSYATDALDDLTQYAAQKTDKVIGRGMDTLTGFQKDAEEYTDSAAKYIKKNPIKSALIAAGVGLLLGRFL